MSWQDSPAASVAGSSAPYVLRFALHLIYTVHGLVVLCCLFVLYRVVCTYCLLWLFVWVLWEIPELPHGMNKVYIDLFIDDLKRPTVDFKSVPMWWGRWRLTRAAPSFLQRLLPLACRSTVAAGLSWSSASMGKLLSNHTCLRKKCRLRVPTRKPRQKAHLEDRPFMVTAWQAEGQTQQECQSFDSHIK